MKIGIITLNAHLNYGNRLQNYALQEFLLNYAVEVDTIWYNDNLYSPIFYNKKKFSFLYIKYLLKYILNWNNIRERERKKKNNIYEEFVREYNIKKFSDKYINIRYDYKIKKQIINEYDFFVVGSDQIWYPHRGISNIEFLKFVPYDKRIAYAPSFGVGNITKWKDLIKNGLSEMKYISIREKSGAKIIKILIGKDVPILVDPTILLYKEKWQKISMKPEWYNGNKYILTYFLGDLPSVVKELTKKYNYKIINLMDKNNFEVYVSRVEEFIYLIDNAELVCTDSFHGTVFSILMNTPFLVLNRKEKGIPDMTSRIDTLLELFKYQDRYITDSECELSDEEILHMNFNNVRAIQDQEISRSIKYIKKALNLE